TIYYQKGLPLGQLLRGSGGHWHSELGLLGCVGYASPCRPHRDLEVYGHHGNVARLCLHSLRQKILPDGVINGGEGLCAQPVDRGFGIASTTGGAEARFLVQRRDQGAQG